PTATINDIESSFEPGTGVEDLQSGLNVKLHDLSKSQESSSTLALRGMQSLRFIPLSLDSDIQLQSPWPHPEFFGSSLPLSHNISDQGFTANWQVNQFSTGVRGKLKACEQGSCSHLDNMSFGVKFIEGVDIYLQATRAVKYGILFISLSFVTFFIYESIKKMRIHAVQY